MSQLAQKIRENVEFLATTEGDSIACISIEELTGILNEIGLLTKLDERLLLAGLERA